MSPLSSRIALWFAMSALAVVCVTACGDRRKLEGDVWGDDPGRPARLNGGARLDGGAASGEPRRELTRRWWGR